MAPRQVLVLTTGGTFDTVYADGGLAVGDPAAPWILANARVGDLVRVEPVLAKDSKEITDGDRDLLLARIRDAEASAVVVIHGTDTLTQTAEHLDGRCPEGTTVVLTGAMQPAAMRDTDASFNLGAAVLASQLLPAGVHVVMNGRVHRAGQVVKDRARGVFVPR